MIFFMVRGGVCVCFWCGGVLKVKVEKLALKVSRLNE
jgi:hypothetical protein